MKMHTWLLVATWLGCAHAQELHRLKVEPFDFQSEEAGFSEHYLDSYGQMIFQGRDLYLRSHRDPSLIRIHTDELAVDRISRRGEGPGEFRNGASHMAVRGNHLWTVDWGRSDRILHFVNDKYKDAVIIDSMYPQIPMDGLSLAVSDREIIAPLSPRTGHLAMAYGFDGSKTPVGQIPFDKKDGDLVFRISNMNQTLWHFGGDNHWYAAFPYAAMVYKFNRKFEKVGHFSFEHPLLRKRLEYIQEFEPERPGHRCNPLTTDIKWFRNRLYVMSAGYLMQLDPQSGELLSISRFSVKDPDDPGPGLKAFSLFAFRDDGTIFLGHPVCHNLSGHDMFKRSNLPFLNGMK